LFTAEPQRTLSKKFFLLSAERPESKNHSMVYIFVETVDIHLKGMQADSYLLLSSQQQKINKLSLRSLRLCG